MRAIAFAAVLMGCSTTPSQLPEGQTIEVLTPAQVRQAFQGRAACEVYPEDGACETIAFLEESSRDLLVFRGVGANDIDSLATDPLAQVVRGLQMFGLYDELFRGLAAERARGGYLYLKTVTTSRGARGGEGRWCTSTSPSENFEDVEFYFSNNLTPDTSVDIRLSPESQRGLRTFLRSLAADQEFRTLVEGAVDTPEALEEAHLMLALFAGVDECWSYGGVVRAGRVEMTSIQTFVEGRMAPHLRRTIRPLSLNEPLALRAN
jgi:hypothetical protein